VKGTIENEYCNENSTVRVVFCTIAFGMGVNVKGAHIGIHLGPSSTMAYKGHTQTKRNHANEKDHTNRKKETMQIKKKPCKQKRNRTNEKETTQTKKKLVPRALADFFSVVFLTTVITVAECCPPSVVCWTILRMFAEELDVLLTLQVVIGH